MATKNLGEQLGYESAFPIPDLEMEHEVGLTKREYFAGQAMQGELACQSDDNGTWTADSSDRLAKRCVSMADALLKELAREK